MGQTRRSVAQCYPHGKGFITRLTLQALSGRPVGVELFDLEQATFTRTHALEHRFLESGAEVWHVVRAPSLAGGQGGRSEIQTRWEKGEELWRTLRFVVVVSDGEAIDPADLPPRHLILRAVMMRVNRRRIIRSVLVSLKARMTSFTVGPVYRWSVSDWPSSTVIDQVDGSAAHRSTATRAEVSAATPKPRGSRKNGTG